MLPNPILSAINTSVGRQLATLTLVTCPITSSIMICSSNKMQNRSNTLWLPVYTATPVVKINAN